MTPLTDAIPPPVAARPGRLRRFRVTGGSIGAAILLLVALPCVVTLPWSLNRYERVADVPWRSPPSRREPMGTDHHGRSVLWRCLLGGAVSLGVGGAAALIAVVIGVAWGAIAGYAGGGADAVMMRGVDVLYGLPYVLLVVLVKFALEPALQRGVAAVMPGEGDESAAAAVAGVLTLLIAIGGVSWLTMSRVIRGQVLSLRGQPFVEAARACGLGPVRILLRHVLPNLIGPIIVYTTLTVPAAILQESFLSFLGIGVQPPLPSWGNLAAEGLGELHALTQKGMRVRWWLIVWPCTLLGLTLLALNFLGDALRSRLDPRSRSRP